MQTPAARRELRPRRLHRQARRAQPGASKERLECRAGELVLPEEAGHRCARQARLVGTAAPARDQDDARSICTRGQALGHFEAVHARQLHVEQDDVRPEPLDRVERCLAVLDRPDDLEALELQERRRRRPESRRGRRRSTPTGAWVNRPTDRRRSHCGWHGLPGTISRARQQRPRRRVRARTLNAGLNPDQCLEC